MRRQHLVLVSILLFSILTSGCVEDEEEPRDHHIEIEYIVDRMYATSGSSWSGSPLNETQLDLFRAEDNSTYRIMSGCIIPRGGVLLGNFSGNLNSPRVASATLCISYRTQGSINISGEEPLTWSINGQNHTAGFVFITAGDLRFERVFLFNESSFNASEFSTFQVEIEVRGGFISPTIFIDSIYLDVVCKI